MHVAGCVYVGVQEVGTAILVLVGKVVKFTSVP